MALELEDSDDDDKMERKRRRQLTERWSMLEEDSVRRTPASLVSRADNEIHARLHPHTRANTHTSVCCAPDGRLHFGKTIYPFVYVFGCG